MSELASVADGDLIDAVLAEEGAMRDLLRRLVEAPTLLGREELGQAVMREALREAGLDPVDVPMDAAALRAHPGASPFSWDVSQKSNVVATWEPDGPALGRSLVLNGHIDVVSPEPSDLWTRDPFRATIEGDWMYGRGAGDMKCGLAAMVCVVRALGRLGLRPASRLQLQSVVEEECTGNGALACVLAGHVADAAVCVEPFGRTVSVAQVGVLWFHVRVAARAAHVGEAALGLNAIEGTYTVIRALRELERDLNAEPAPPPFDAVPHPLNLNVGVIMGGDWPSSVPGACVSSYRVGLLPGEQIADVKTALEGCIAEAAAADPLLRDNPPHIRYDGFACQGYALDQGEPILAAVQDAAQRVLGERPPPIACTATTDARAFGLHAGVPAVCFGPHAERLHAADERVLLPSITQTAQTLALLVRDWCGLTS